MKQKILLICITLFLGNATAEAQLFRKIKEKINNVTGSEKESESNPAEGDENTEEVTPPTQEEQEAQNTKLGNFFGGGLEEIRDTYTFSYSLVYELKTNKESMSLEYLLEPKADYFANQMNEQQGNRLMVYDFKKNAMVTFMDNGEQKMAMKMKMPNIKKSEEKFGKKIIPEDDEDVQIIPIEGKKILGYKCDGYKVISKDGVGKFWVTNDAPVTINGVYANFKSLPKSARNYPITVNSLMLEMNYIANKGKRDNMEMLCTQLVENSVEIHKKDYQSGF